MLRRPPRSTRTDTLFPYTTLFRSIQWGLLASSAERFMAEQNSPWHFEFIGIDVIADDSHCPWIIECKLHPAIVICVQRSEEHTSELQSLMRNSYAVFCLKKKNNLYRI